MRTTRRMAVLGLLTGAVSLGLANAPAAANNGQGSIKTISLQLLSFNDYHGHLDPPSGAPTPRSVPTLDPSGTPVGGAEYLSSKLTQLRAGVEHSSVTVTAGDLIGGSPRSCPGLFHDEPSVETLEAMGLDVSSVGNHEFDEGLTELYRMQNGGCHPVGWLLRPRRTLRRCRTSHGSPPTSSFEATGQPCSPRRGPRSSTASRSASSA